MTQTKPTNGNTKMQNAANIYDSLFNGRPAPLSKEQQEEYDKITKDCEAKVAKMTDAEKAAEFDRIMGR